MMALLANPRNLVESFGLTMLLLRISGLFPYYFEESKLKFCWSWKGFGFTLFHMIIYTYVNISSLIANWKDYSQPMIGHSSLTIFGNLTLRLTGILTTFFIFLPLFRSNAVLNALNIYNKILEELILLDINVAKVLNQVYYLSLAFTFIWAALLAFTSWHSIHFYQYITLKEPEIKYYLVVTLTNFYKSMFMYYLVIQLFSLYMMSKELNKFLNDLQQKYQHETEVEKTRKYVWSSK
uniref:Uncharacterized protein n=1 Tax=Glossina brevipalpis TaxID=37001 RepID=A0A1A9WIY4_9MUSC